MRPDRIAELREDAERWDIGPSDLRECLDEIERLAEEASKSRIYETSASELLELLADGFKGSGNLDAMTLFLYAFLAGIKGEWLKTLPANGFTCATKLPEVGEICIDIHRFEGKSPARAIQEQRAEIERLRGVLGDVRAIKDRFPFDSADAATECIRLAKEGLGE